jgi:hypothetical protein
MRRYAKAAYAGRHARPCPMPTGGRRPRRLGHRWHVRSRLRLRRQPRLLPRINGLVKTAQGSKHPQLSSLMSHLADAFPRVKIYAATCRSSCGSCSPLQCCGAPADEKGHPDRVAMHASQGGGDSLLGRTGLLGDTGTCARRRAVACHLENLLDRLDHLFGAAVMHHVAGIRPDVQL